MYEPGGRGTRCALTARSSGPSTPGTPRQICVWSCRRRELVRLDDLARRGYQSRSDTRPVAPQRIACVTVGRIDPALWKVVNGIGRQRVQRPALLLLVPRAAKLLGISRQSAYRLAAAGAPARRSSVRGDCGPSQTRLVTSSVFQIVAAQSRTAPATDAATPTRLWPRPGVSTPALRPRRRRAR